MTKAKDTPGIKQRADGKWTWRKRAQGPLGKKRLKGVARTKVEAERAMHRAVELWLHPLPVITKPIAVATVAEYATIWIGRRKQLGISTVNSDEIRLRLHALPHLGPMRLNEVKPRHLRDLVYALRADGKLAPRSILKVTATLFGLFKSAFVEELVPGNPVVFEPGVLPKKADKDPTWRHNAVYTRDEIEQLISDDRIPADRRILYALKTLAALRHSEAADLTWRLLDTATKPLGSINLGKTKSGVPRAVPIHPTLAKMLATWKLAGWFNSYGRQPNAEDLIVPTLTFKRRAPKEAQEALVGDLLTLGLRVQAGVKQRRRGHDMRRTFVSLAQADGARRDVIEHGTHGPRGDIMSMYTTLPWQTICEEWGKLRIELHEGALITLRHDHPSALIVRARKRWAPDATTKLGGPQTGPAATKLAAAFAQMPAAVIEKVVTPLGLEPKFSP